MTQISDLLPLLIPIIVLELILVITALIHIFRHKTYRFGNRVLWVVLVLCFQLIGPVVYFIFGRGDD
ncbi:hypothetical protein E4665_05980 [Sporolactobacillus shoreae]|uniref:Cardiolipin synthase N-terminal domain-containing protein n=1 Tax=Sporolactobacillus shoreae TaxID=1465501 RepID=A0A4Z0GQM9_9BACL|nr:PLDc N-terminal domain-containing protein [Sporolactobacillus shoreae]TGA98874.1 hypothetical protein E4665_05980 [Sporolactobacillus shoreae]